MRKSRHLSVQVTPIVNGLTTNVTSDSSESFQSRQRPKDLADHNTLDSDESFNSCGVSLSEVLTNSQPTDSDKSFRCCGGSLGLSSAQPTDSDASFRCCGRPQDLTPVSDQPSSSEESFHCCGKLENLSNGQPTSSDGSFHYCGRTYSENLGSRSPDGIEYHTELGSADLISELSTPRASPFPRPNRPCLPFFASEETVMRESLLDTTAPSFPSTSNMTLRRSSTRVPITTPSSPKLNSSKRTFKNFLRSHLSLLKSPKRIASKLSSPITRKKRGRGR